MPTYHDGEVEIILADDSDSGDWTPARGLRTGTIATLAVALLLGAGWCYLAWKRPDVAVTYSHEDGSVTGIMGAVGGMIAFFICWVLFATMHRASRMVSVPCTVVVVVIVLLMLVAKQLTVAATPGVDTLDGVMVSGKAWFEPSRFITSNVGVWFAIALAVYVFRDGDSIMVVFGKS
ncbi:MAG: hypothetical protein H6817_06670 [Phycisphaerales bacterium]|nr:hypothetical protein [Phycisphaerales bacterium]